MVFDLNWIEHVSFPHGCLIEHMYLNRCYQIACILMYNRRISGQHQDKFQLLGILTLSTDCINSICFFFVVQPVVLEQVVVFMHILQLCCPGSLLVHNIFTENVQILHIGHQNLFIVIETSKPKRKTFNSDTSMSIHSLSMSHTSEILYK